MAGLKECLEKIGLESHEKAIINGAVRDYQSEGYPAWGAATIAVRDYIKRLEEERRDIERQIAAESAGGGARASAKEGAIGPPKGVRRSVFSQSKLWSPRARRTVEDRILRDALTNDAFFEMVGERRVPPLDLDHDTVDDYIAEAFPEWADEIEYVYSGVERPQRGDFETDAEYREALADYEDLSGWAAKAYREAVESIRQNAEARYKGHAERILKKLRALEKEFETVPKDLLASIRAFHGSPHRFARFDSGKIGTGEGAQAFGWGLYFSDEKEVARHYAGLGDPQGVGRRWSFENVDWADPAFDAQERAGMITLLTDGRAKIWRGEWKTVKDARNDYETQLRIMERDWGRYRETVGEGEAEYRRDAARAALAYLDKHPEARIVEPEGGGGQYVYRVVIHNGKRPDQYDYLDWHDPPTKDQVEKIRKQVEKSYAEGNPLRRGLLNILDEVERSLGKPNAKMRLRGSELYSDLSFELGFRQGLADKETSLLLLAAGIDGIKYRAGSLSGGAYGFSHNYVVFDDSEVAIEALEDLQGRPIELAASVKQLGLFGDETEAGKGEQRKPAASERPKAQQAELGLELPEAKTPETLELQGERAGAKEAFRAKKLMGLASVKQIPARFASTNEALAFGRYATAEQIQAMRDLYAESKARTAALIKQSKLDEAMAEAARGQFFREAIDAAEGRIDLAKWADPLIPEEKTRLVDPEPGKFSFKEAPPLRPPGPVQARLFPEVARPAARAKKAEARPAAPAVPPPPEAEIARIWAEIATGAPAPKPGEAPGKVVPFVRVRMETTGSIAAAGNVVRDIDDAAALLATIRKSAQEMAFTIAVAADGTVLEIHRYSRGTASGASLSYSEIIGRLFNTPGAAAAYFFHNHPGGTTSPSKEDLHAARMLRALGNMAKMPVRSGIIAGTQFVEIDDKGEAQAARPIRPTIRRTKLPVRERCLVRSARDTRLINNSKALKEYLADQFPGEQGILFLDARLGAAGFMPWPDISKPTRAAVEVLKAREFVNAGVAAVVLDHKATAQERDFIVAVQDLSGGGIQLIEVLQGGESAADTNNMDTFRSGAVAADAERAEAAARRLAEKEYPQGSVEDEARFSVRAEADRRFAAGIRDWRKLRPTQSVRLDYTPDVLRMLGAEDLPIEIDQETIQKVLEPSRVAGGKHGRIGVQELMDLPIYLNRPIMVFDSKTLPGALVVMTEIVDADGDTAVAAIHLSKRKGHRVVNNIASVYGKDDEQFFLREIKAGRLRYIDEKKSRRWAEKRKISFPSTTEAFAPGAIIRALIALRGKDPGAFKNIVLTEKDLVKFIREGRFSARFQPVDTESPAFKRWFGNSKVVDKNGEPLVVYHGTASADDFNVFDPGLLGLASQHHGSQLGFFFTESPIIAESFLRDAAWEPYRERGRIIPAYLRITRPYRMRAEKIGELFWGGVEDWRDAAADEARWEKIRNLRAELERKGYDGIYVSADAKRKTGAPELYAPTWIAFHPTQIKSAIGNVGTFDPENPDIRFSTKSPVPVWHSHMQRFLERKLPGSGTPEQLAKTIRGWADKGEIKAEELEWSGLEDWLKGQKGKVSKQEVLNWLSANNVSLVEIMRAGVHEDLRKAERAVIEQAKAEDMSDSRARAYAEDAARGALTDQKISMMSDEMRPLVDRLRQLYLQKSKEGLAHQPRHEDWQLSGGKNYRELLLVFSREGSERYYSHHWEEPNVLAHVRFNERTTLDGKRMLFVEEVQSDWHQQGKRYGYEADKRFFVIKRRRSDASREVVARFATYREALDEEKRLDAIFGEEADTYHTIVENLTPEVGVPDAPFKKSWPLLVMKRMVRYAAENGFDAIGWTTGEQQAKRYDLRKHVQSIKVLHRPDGTYQIQMLSNGHPDSDYETLVQSAPKEKLPEYIGKELSQKVAEQRQGEEREYSGLDLVVGGAGMHGFYDRILPAELNKFFGKPTWGNARVGETEIAIKTFHLKRYEGPSWTIDELRQELRSGRHPATLEAQIRDVITAMETGDTWNEAIDRHGSTALAEALGGKKDSQRVLERVWYLPVTPEMRQRALEEGMPLFSLRRLSPEAQDYIAALRAAQAHLGRPAPSENDLEADPFEGLPDDVKARLQAAKGVPKPGLLDRAKIMGLDVWHSLTRHRPYLDPKADATIADILRTHQDTPRNSVRRALQVLQAITGGLRPKQYEAFTMTIVMRDMIRDLDSGLLTGKEGLPFGFDEKTARSYLEHLERVSAADPAVAEALRKREAFDRKLKQALVAAELLPEAVLKDQAYFHHQVLKYQALKALGGQYQGIGVGPTQDVRLRKKGWQIARTGSIEDYNTQYVQAEFEVIAQALAQLETRDVMRQVAGRADISESLRKKAKRMNYVAVVGGEEAFARLLDLRATASRIRELAEGKPDSEDKKRLKEIAEKIREIDPTMPFREKIAIGLAKLADTLGLDPDEASFDDELINMRELAKYAKSDDEALSIPARMVFKAMAEREKFIRDTLGRDYATAERIIPDGYVEWFPKPGGSWYRAYSITDRVAAQVLAGEVVLGPENAEKIRQVLARGKPESWIIPEGMAKTLDGYDAKFDDHVLAKASRTLMDAWKKWTLINPFRVVRYNLNNLSGDLDIAFAYDPRILTHYLAGAIRDLWGDYRNKTIKPELRAEFDLANRLGVLDSGWSVQEVWDVAKELSLKEHMLALSGEKPHLIARGWKGLENFTRYRENWARLAAFRYFRDAIARGEKVYGASNRAEVYGIDDPDRKAAKLARELIGDYGNLTHAGQFIRRHLIPFYAWMEINAPRYARMMRNLKHEGRGGEARLAALFGKNIAWKATKLGAKAAFLMTMVALWNHTFFPDEEDELGEEQRRQMHLILGRRKDGSIISLRFQGALSDALSWFGAEDVIEDVRKLRKGTAAVSDIAKDAALAGPIKIINALRPDVKVLGEVIGGRAWYPDPFNPKPIRDKLQHVVRTFSAGSLYDWAAGKPKRGGTVGERLANDLLALGFYTSDPGETAYYDIVKRVADWREKAGKEQPAIVPTDKANALYYYKQALKFGDIGAAERYLNRYYELGGTERGLGESIKRAHPLGMIAKKDRSAFLKTLSPEEMERYRLALRWYQETYRGEAAAEAKATVGRQAASPTKDDEAAPVAGGMTLREAAELMK